MFLGFTDDTYIIGVQNDYARDMLQHRLVRNVRRVLSSICGYNVNVRFEVLGPATEVKPTPEPAQDEEMPLFRFITEHEPEQAAEEKPEGTLDKGLPQLPVQPDLPESEINPRFTFDRYIVNNSNRVVL